MGHQLVMKIEGDFQEVAMVCVSVKALCLHFSLPGIVAYQVTLCIDEILNNIIEHGFNFQKQAPIFISVNFQDQELSMEISYDGPPATMNQSVRPEFDPEDIENLPERGHGWLLVNEIMDSLANQRTGQRNCITMVKKLPELSMTGVR